MRFRLAIALLALASLGTNSLLLAMCAVHCTPSSGSGPAHHHPMASQYGPKTSNLPVQNDDQDTVCTGCAAETDVNVMLSSDCSGLAQVNALIERSFTLAASRTVAHHSVPQLSAQTITVADGRKHAWQRNSSENPRGFTVAPVSLRI
jgi:hypothetical protein